MAAEFLKRLFRGKKDSGYEFTDEDRDKAVVAKKRNAVQKDLLDLQREELQHLKEVQQQRRIQEEINEIRRNLYNTDSDDDEEQDVDAMFFENILKPILHNRQQGNATAVLAGDMDPLLAQHLQGQGSAIPSDAVSKVHMSDEELQQFKEGLPSFVVKMAKKQDDTAIRKAIRAHMPGLDDDTEDRAVDLLKS